MLSKRDLQRNVNHRVNCPNCGHRTKTTFKLGSLLKFLHRNGILVKYLAHLKLITIN